MGRDRNAISNTSARVMEEVGTEAGDMAMACKGSFLWKLDLNLTFIRTKKPSRQISLATLTHKFLSNKSQTLFISKIQLLPWH